MNIPEIVPQLLARLDAGAARRSVLEQYYRGEQPLAYLTPEARTAIGNRFARMFANVPRLAVNSLAERLRITGFNGGGQQLWSDWLANDLDQLSPVTHREALTLGEAFVIVWADPQGAPLVSVESAHQVAVVRDPATRAVTAAVKRWEHRDPAGNPIGTEVMVYGPDQVTHLSSLAIGANTGFQVVEQIHNPFGMVPVIPFSTGDRLLGCPASELDDVLPLVDALNKVLTDMMVSSEYVGRPRRWATGVEVIESEVLDAAGNPTGEVIEVNPYSEANRMMLAENPEAKFGQLAAADLDGYQAAVTVLQAQISAVSGLPPHYLGVHGDQPASADALRASEASLTARAEARQQSFGRSWEQVAKLMAAVRTGQDPHKIEVGVSWADPSTRSVAQEADATVKLVQAGILPRRWALKKLGYTDAEVAEIEATNTNQEGTAA